MPRLNSPVFRFSGTLLLVSALAGCAVNDQREAPEVVSVNPIQQHIEPSPSDPFSAVDSAFQRLALERLELGDTDPARVQAAPADLWPRLVDRFRIARCPAGSASARWASWYGSNGEYMNRVLARAQPWLLHIVDEIENRDLPGELALLPVVESAFDPFAYSHGRAAGPWQFLSGTAGDFGIEINDWYDGRRDFFASTSAALDYLEYLSNLFDGDWALALAAYNAGQGRVGRAIRRNAARGRGTEWHELPLPAETLGYVPKLKGLGCLFQDPAAYGFALPELTDQPRVAIVKLSGPTDVAELASLAGLDVAELVSLNAGLNKHMTPPSGPHYIVVPAADADRARAVLGDLSSPKPTGGQQVRIQRGDTLSRLARRHGTTIEALREANGLGGDRLVAGRMLRLPGSYAEPGGLDGDDDAADTAYRAAYRELIALQQQLLPTDRFIHRVRSGESLWVIARRYGLSVSEVQRMNGLGSTLIRPGQRLVIETGRKISAPAEVSRYVVQRGDSLWHISRRHQIGMDDLMRWNGLEADSVLQPGQQLVIRRGSDA